MKYVRRREIGRGAFGSVWEAWDSELSRRVAIKFLRGDEPQDLERFKREARTAARLSHPNIVPVYDVGESDGEHFIVLEFVDGAPADARRLTPREAAEVARQVAGALHHAHSQGVIHRDLKPGNILLTGDPPQARVTDFGLAKQVGTASSLSMTGDVMGTPAFMSPEQARGEVRAVDARSDVWSIGATLYALCAGGPPFRGDEVYKILKGVIEDDPPPPRLGRDLDTIILKCLEKEPARRYATALELEQDLTRYLAGEPIHARPPSTFYRLRKRMARHPVATALLAAAILAAGAAVRQYVRAERRAAELEQATQMLEISSAYWAMEVRVGGVIRLAEELGALVPIHQRRKWFDAVVAAAAETRAKYPGAGTPDAYEALMLCLIGEQAEGLPRFERAVRACPRDPFVPLWRARFHLALYFRRLVPTSSRLGVTGVRLDPDTPETPEMKEWMRRAIEDLAPLERSDLWTHLKEGRGFQNVARGILRWAEHDDAAVLREVEPVTADAAAGLDALRLIGVARFRMQQFEASARAFGEASRRLPNSTGFAAWEAQALLNQGTDLAARGEDPKDVYAASIEASDRAILIWPAPMFLRNRGIARWGLGNAMARGGTDPRDLYRRAIEDCTAAISGLADWDSPRVQRALAYWSLGEAEADRGVDPRPSFRSGIADLDRVLERSPDDGAALNVRGITFWRLAEAEGLRGADPRSLYHDGIRDLQRAAELDATSAEVRNNLGTAWCYLGEAERNINVDPRPSYRKAVECFDQAAERDAQYALPHVNRCNTIRSLGEVEGSLGGDGREVLGRAVEAGTTAIGLQPQNAEAHVVRGLAHLARAVEERRLGGRSDEEFGLAETDLHNALRINAQHWLALANLGILYEQTGRLPEAVAVLERAAKINPAHPGIQQSLEAVRKKARADF